MTLTVPEPWHWSLSADENDYVNWACRKKENLVLRDMKWVNNGVFTMLFWWLIEIATVPCHIQHCPY